jgi:hypothetical protein
VQQSFPREARSVGGNAFIWEVISIGLNLTFTVKFLSDFCADSLISLDSIWVFSVKQEAVFHPVWSLRGTTTTAVSATLTEFPLGRSLLSTKCLTHSNHWDSLRRTYQYHHSILQGKVSVTLGYLGPCRILTWVVYFSPCDPNPWLCCLSWMGTGWRVTCV